ncbi:ABC transporter substrate-binding protein [Duganella sp. FT80W]|uniref:ABC transporter substrate-binding protein n=1 Tax=Duganella guangzhouensis TaxID=2666084 RepID=A0A6I2KY57_9BURK|nr:ABC transporter substrate-binding protein [Duganella guangzhouensis]MRW90683.1 ABC transporter substrate-binding protein [Duganella guangzhouensis]
MSTSPVDTIWFTRCPVPTATGLAYKLGWLDQEFAADGIAIKTLQEAGGELSKHHYDHQLNTLIREGGNLLAIPARAQGAPTRLIGLTWIDEWQSILVRPGSGINQPADLKGKRLALPPFRADDIANNRRGNSIARGMSLAGYKGVLAAAGLALEDAVLVELATEEARNRRSPELGDWGRADLGGGLWQGIAALNRGEVDAIYVKGAAAAHAAREAGLVVGIDIDNLPHKRFRVNNGTPRPITVHEDFLKNHRELVVRFLTQTLRAADWARHNLAELRRILQDETRGSADSVVEAYRDGFHLDLAPDLSQERLELFAQQKNFQLIHGLLDRDFDLNAWVDHGPIEEARQRLQATLPAAA